MRRVRRHWETMAREPAIEVGAYVLQLGESGGTIVQQGEGAAEAEVEPLREAFAESGPEAPAPEQPDVADEVGEAAEATEKVEKAVALCKGVTEGQGLSPDMLALEVGTLLDCLERLDRKGTGLNEHVWTFLLGLTVRP